MTFKLFRRGSARYIGLLSAFVTILLCLYYISIGQPNPTHIPDANAVGLTVAMGRSQASSAAALGGFSVGGGSTSHHHHHQQEPQQNHLVASKDAAIKQLQGGADEELDKQRNGHWGDKCYMLLQSETNITAAEEHSRFDFQVKDDKSYKNSPS